MAEELDTCGEVVEIDNVVEVADDNAFVELNEIEEPSVGMIFSSFQEAKCFYDDYGHSKGFATRTRSTYRDRRGPDVTSALLVCTCEGFNQKTPKTDDENKARRCTIVRSGCKASMRVTNIRGTTAWKVTVFSDQHNHELFTQKKGDVVKNNKRKSRSVKTPKEAMRSCDVYRQAARLAQLAGRSEEIYEVIMAVMEETFKKVSQMEKELFSSNNDGQCFDEASENQNFTSICDQVTPANLPNDYGETKNGTEMDSHMDELDNGLWESITNNEGISSIST
ncbi:hypothetical protein ACHQM5_011174 [Ranunculus cassubicifolius]